MNEIKCAIYTRKSVDDGTLLTQDFSSLDAQREACENYISSQKSKGWVCLPERYDDGGYSGGNLNRPALARLKEDIEAGKIDIVVTYKIDRLSRSLVNFTELQTFFEANNTSFVSVTQEVNTSTSSGRMMLNILMTFAQFEREVITERVRDKISASKKRGKFCGGSVVLGYERDPVTKKLKVRPDEAETVRLIFEKYLLLGSINELVVELNSLGIKTKDWTAINTRRHHKPHNWTVSAAHRLLTNPLYVGKIKHYDELYKGEHEAIVDEKRWKEVQDKLSSRGMKGIRHHSSGNPFLGMIFCGHCGCALTPAYTKRHGRKYGYYICSKAHKDPSHQCPLRRIPCSELEKLVLKQIANIFKTPSILRATLAAVHEREENLRCCYEQDIDRLTGRLVELRKEALNENADFDEIKRIAEMLTSIRKKVKALAAPVAEEEVIKALNDVNGLWEFMFPGTKSELLRMVLGKIIVFPEQISFVLKVEGLKDLAEEMAMSGFFNMVHEQNTEIFPEAEQEVLEDGSIKLTMRVDSKRIDGHRHLVILAPGAERLKQTSLLRAIQKSRQWTDMLINGEAGNVTDLAEKLGYKPSYVTRILSLNNLAPDIVESILAGTEPEGMSIAKITAQPIPEDWNEQRRLYGFPVR